MFTLTLLNSFHGKQLLYLYRYSHKIVQLHFFRHRIIIPLDPWFSNTVCLRIRLDTAFGTKLVNNVSADIKKNWNLIQV
jgi:hypothetical protein